MVSKIVEQFLSSVIQTKLVGTINFTFPFPVTFTIIFLMTSLENDKTSLKYRLVSTQSVNYTFRLNICPWQTHRNWVFFPFCLEQWKSSHQQWMSILIDKHGVHAPHFLIPFYSIKQSQSNSQHAPWLALNISVVNKRSSVSWIGFFQYIHFKLIESFYINSFSNIFPCVQNVKVY